uniref:Ran-binding protein 3-like n=1 Tax=Monodelphis domestica TaxID=13616 RepID=A0A5F8HDG5_MONDO
MSQEIPSITSQMIDCSCISHGKSHNSQLACSCSCDLKRNTNHCQEKNVIAQPVFVFENRDQPFKRPAEDTLDKIEYGLSDSSRKRIRSSSFTFYAADTNRESTSSQKRIRSSSFTVFPTFPPSQPVKKNNVFMTTTVSQWNVDIARKVKGPWERNQQCPILRPAILQPPQSLRCVERNAIGHVKAVEFSKSNEKAKTQLSEENLHMLSENSSPHPLVRSFPSLHLFSPIPISQPNEDRSSLQSNSPDFIFGEKMNERVLSPQKSIELHQEKEPYNREKPFTSSVSFPLHFSCTSSCRNTTLKESAAAFSSKLSPKCILEKIEVITGEEEEHNVLKINCKLFVFKKTTQSWTERGRGTLRLNDTANNSSRMLQSRLIMRNQGSLRLILNSKLWAQMEIQRASLKNLRITATDLDDCCIKIFLIQASAKDVGCLYAAIHHRLVALRTFCKQELEGNEIETESETVIQLLSCDSCDEDDDILKITTGGSGKLIFILLPLKHSFW